MSSTRPALKVKSSKKPVRCRQHMLRNVSWLSTDYMALCSRRYNSSISNSTFFLWTYNPILGLGRLLETFRFISVSRSRTVDRTPWTCCQVVARPLLTAPGNCDDGGWWNERFWQGKPKYSEKTCPDATLSTTKPTCQTRARTRAAAVGSQWLSAWAMARPQILHVEQYSKWKL
jgi:hypothetical protein